MDPIQTKAEAEGVLINIIEGLACTDAYHDGDVGMLLRYFESDVRQYLIEQTRWNPCSEDGHRIALAEVMSEIERREKEK